MITIRQIVVATDFGEPAGSALTYGRNFARAFDATLHVVHVVNDLATTAPISEIPMDLTKVQAQLSSEAAATLDALITDDDRRSLSVETAVLTSPTPARAILSHADAVRADIIIVGTHGRSGIAEFFLGSVAQKIVRSAPCPVLTVRSHERDFVHPDALVKRAEASTGADRR
jgi:nucleotide-binding universal stress UspA family protein